VEQADNGSSKPVNSSNINQSRPSTSWRFIASILRKANISVLDKQPKPQRLAVVKEKKFSKPEKPQATVSQTDIFESRSILWQARCLRSGNGRARLRLISSLW
jgi:hypothetical protein